MEGTENLLPSSCLWSKKGTGWKIRETVSRSHWSSILMKDLIFRHENRDYILHRSWFSSRPKDALLMWWGNAWDRQVAAGTRRFFSWRLFWEIPYVSWCQTDTGHRREGRINDQSRRRKIIMLELQKSQDLPDLSLTCYSQLNTTKYWG